MQSRRNRGAARKFSHKLLQGCEYVPRVLIIDKLGSYGAAKREIRPGVEHRQSRYLNNRAENSHQPTRKRERVMRKVQVRRTRPTLLAFGPICDHFCLGRHLLRAGEYRAQRQHRFQVWDEVTGVGAAA